MTVSPAMQPAEKPVAAYRDPVVQSFYVNAIAALDDAKDGASAIAAITGDFQRHHTSFATSNAALHSDIRRLTADDGRKGAMLNHASAFARRMLDEHMRLSGQLHGHQTVESQLHELARQLDDTIPTIAQQIRDILESIQPAPVMTVGQVVISFAPDTRWSTGWFRRTDKGDHVPLEPLAYAGWALVANDPESPAQGPESAFHYQGQWLTASQLADRGLSLVRID